MRKEENHKRFTAQLAKSKNAVWLVSRWLSERGLVVRIPPTTIAATPDDWENHVDDCDLEICQKVDVKHLNVNFSGAADWPFNDFIVCQKKAFDRLPIKPAWIMILSKDKKCIATVNTAKRGAWFVSKRQNKLYKDYSQEFYVCSVESVNFTTIQNYEQPDNNVR